MTSSHRVACLPVSMQLIAKRAALQVLRQPDDPRQTPCGV